MQTLQSRNQHAPLPVVGDAGDCGGTFEREVETIAHLRALWVLRIAALPRYGRTLTQYNNIEDLCSATGLPEPGEKTSAVQFADALNLQLRESEAASVPLEGVFFQNFQRLAALLSLSDAESAILCFAVLLHSDELLEQAFDNLGQLSERDLTMVLARALDLTVQQVVECLRPNGTLHCSGLLRVDRRGPRRMSHKLEVVVGLADELTCEPRDLDVLFGRYFDRAPASTLSEVDFRHAGADLTLIETILRSAVRDRRPGVNILIYGPTGVGKTELARLLSDTLGYPLFEIGMQNDQFEPFQRDDRLSAYQLAQTVLAHQPQHLVLFDEVEDVFPAARHPLFGRIQESGREKAWMNHLLENNPVPALWLSNSVEQIDPAFLRRFEFVLELNAPPRSQRERLLRAQLAELPVTDAWLQRMASVPSLAPSHVERAARITLATAPNSPEQAAQTFERIVGNSLNAMGLRCIPTAGPSTTLAFDYAFINSSIDLRQVTEGLARTRSGRICLYGPPGTGKSAYGAHVAKELDQPVLVKRASDILSKWVGGTERNIAQMFDEARADNAVLLLDEADSFLQDRRGAERSWEVTQVNELLTQMEQFEGILICTTNLSDHLDPAVIRRFDLKIRLEYLEPEQSWALFQRTLGQADGGRLNTPASDGLRMKVQSIGNLTPGDFATVRRKLRITGCDTTPQSLFEGLMAECRAKRDGRPRSMGFVQ